MSLAAKTTMTNACATRVAQNTAVPLIDDLEDADELIETIDSLEPPADLAEAVEGLVRATLLLADVGRPVRKPAGPQRVHPARRKSRPPR